MTEFTRGHGSRITAVAALLLLAVAAMFAPRAPAQVTELPPCEEMPFTDVPVDHPFCPEITKVKDEGFTDGYPDGTFHPTAPLTRQAFAAMGAGPTELPTCDEAPFTDVPVGHPFCSEITFSVDLGIITGYDDGSFHPSAPVTRQAMAAFLVRIFQFGDYPVELGECQGTVFSDVTATNRFCSEIEWLAGTGIISGYSDGTFKPTNPVTRQAFAAFVVRLSAMMTTEPL